MGIKWDLEQAVVFVTSKWTKKKKTMNSGKEPT